LYLKPKQIRGSRKEKKRLKDLYDANKKTMMILEQFRLQVAIDMEEEILKNDKSSLNIEYMHYWIIKNLFQPKQSI
jgi:hypothetical protein